MAGDRSEDREWICIDLTRTRGWRERDRPDDDLVEPADLASWGAGLGLISEPETEDLEDWLRGHPQEAQEDLAYVRRFRRVLHGVLRASARGESPDPDSLMEFNRVLAEGQAQRRITPENGGFTWSWAEGRPSLRRIAWAAAVSAAELLTSEMRSRLKACAADDCGWVFLDHSRNRSRRWCDMSDCGNRAKVRRFRSRHGAEG